MSEVKSLPPAQEQTQKQGWLKKLISSKSETEEINKVEPAEQIKVCIFCFQKGEMGCY